MTKDTELEERWGMPGPVPKWFTLEVADHVDRIVAAAPPFSADQKALIRSVFNSPNPTTDPDDLDTLREVIGR